MVDFLEFIRSRRLALQKEMRELDSAERLYLKAQQGAIAFDLTPPIDNSSSVQNLLTGHPRRTIKGMVRDLLTSTQPNGLTALQLLDLMKLHWGENVERTSLSPQLTRLKDDGVIFNEHGVWKIKKQDAPPADETDEAPEPS
jgi:hypothetical protein